MSIRFNASLSMRFGVVKKWNVNFVSNNVFHKNSPILYSCIFSISSATDSVNTWFLTYLNICYPLLFGGKQSAAEIEYDLLMT